MPTLFRVGSWRVVIFSNDHSPAHVHAIGPDGYARFALGRTPDDVTLLETEGIPVPVLRRLAARIIDRHRECLDAWSAIHGNPEAD